MTAALEGGEWSAARPGHTLPPGKTRYPLHRRLGGPRAGRDGRKISSPLLYTIYSMKQRSFERTFIVILCVTLTCNVDICIYVYNVDRCILNNCQGYFKNYYNYYFGCCKLSLLSSREHHFFLSSKVKLLFLSGNTAMFSLGL